MQEPRAEHERGRLAASRVEDHAFDDSDARPAGAHAEPLGICEPVLEHIAAPAEHVRPHSQVLTATPPGAKPQKIPSVLARATASVLEPASSLRRIALTW